jgi:hypothetical protein
MRDPRLRLLLMSLLGVFLTLPLLIIVGLTVASGFQVGDGERTLVTLLPIAAGVILVVVTVLMLFRARGAAPRATGGRRLGLGSMPRREISRPTVRFTDVAGGDRRVPPRPRAAAQPGGDDPQGRSPRRPSRHRQDAAEQGGRR